MKLKSLKQNFGFLLMITAIAGLCAVNVSADKSTSETVQSKSEKEREQKTKEKKPRKNIKLPGLLVNFEKGYVDLDATICLDKGALELIACTKGTKEHESIVTVDSQPNHIHVALLLLGVKPGHPSIHQQLGEGDSKRWVHLPPKGDGIKISLVYKDKKKQIQEQSISHFVIPNRGELAEEAKPKATSVKEKFPSQFLFTGSVVKVNNAGQKIYMSGVSGNVISISTFGDELLGLPEVVGHENIALLWRINQSTIPAVGTKVKLRLRPHIKTEIKKQKKKQTKSKD